MGTFTRNSTAYLQDGTLVNTNLPRFEAGRFGQVVMIEEGTTNLVAEMMSQARSGLASNDGAFSTLTLVSDFGRSSNFSALSEQVTVGGNAGFFASGEANWQSVTAGLVYTASCWVFTNAVGRSATLVIIYRDAVNANLGIFSGATTPLVAGTWTRITATVTAPANAVRAQFIATASISQIGERFWYTDLQLEQRPYATSWQLGGTSRAAETLTIPTAGVLSPTEGTIEFWARPNHASSVAASNGVGFHHLSWHTAGSTQGIIIRRVVGGITLVSLRAAGSLTTTHNMTWIAGQDIHIAARWTATDVSLFVNGALRGTIAKFDGPGSIPLEFGWRTGHTASNALHDDLRISNRARSDAEIAAAFNSGQPLTLDESTTALYSFNNHIVSQVFGYTGNTPAIVVPRGVVNPGLAYAGLTTAETVPSSVLRQALNYTGLTTITTLARSLFRRTINIKSPTHAVIKDSRTRAVIK